MKNIVVGDIVRIKYEDILKKASEYLEEEITRNEFEVKLIDVDEDKKRTEWFVLIGKNADITKTKPFSLEKKELEVIEPTRVELEYEDSFRDMLRFNATGNKILQAIYCCNMRDIERNYLECKLVDGEYMVSFIPFDKMKYFNGDFYDADLRKKYEKLIKPIKIIQEMLKASKSEIEMTQDVVDDLLACINKEINADFELVSGKDISKYYSEDMYASQDGTLGNSCMKHKNLAKAGTFYIYEDSAKLLILKDRTSGKIYGRAIVWTLNSEDETFKGKMLVDRIYVTNDAFVSMFKKWANEHNAFYLREQSFQTHIFIYNEIEYNLREYDDVWVDVDDRINKYMFYPYMDTFYVKIKEELGRLYTRLFDDDSEYEIVAKHARTSGTRHITSLGKSLGLRGGSCDY